MKRFCIILFIGLSVIALAACQPVATSNAVTIPDALTLAFNALVLAFVTFGLQWVFEKIGLDLRGVGTGLAVAVSAFVLAQLQGLINIIPAAYDMLVTIVLNILVVILSGVGFARVLLHRERVAQLFAPKK